MEDVDKFIDDIYSKKLEIAIAIFLAFYNGKFDKDNLDVLSQIIEGVEQSKIMVLNSDAKFATSYEKEINDLLDKITLYLGYDAHSCFYNKSFSIDDEFINSMKFKSEESKVYFSYLLAAKMFLKLGVSYEEFLSRYQKGEDVFELAKLVKTLQRKTLFYDSRKNISDILDMINIDNNVNKMGDIIEKYHVTSIDDITNLYTEVSIALMNDSLLDEEGKQIVKNSKVKLEERCGVHLNKLKLMNLKRTLDDFYDIDLLNSFMHSSNINESIKRNNLTLNKDLLSAAINMYELTLTNRAFNSSKIVGDERYSFVVFPSSLLSAKESDTELTVLHELVHAAEPKDNPKKALSCNFRGLNEALTQYFSHLAYKYYKRDQLDQETIIENIKKDRCSYNCMLPLVEILKNSELWKDVLNMKIKNDFTVLEQKIGKHANEIFNVFDSVYTKSLEKSLTLEFFEECEEQLKKIISCVENDLNRCNKNY